MKKNYYLKELCNSIIGGDLEKSRQILLTQTTTLHSLYPVFYCIIKMKSRNYKLYKTIVLIKLIFRQHKISDRDIRFIQFLALKYNCTYLTKTLIRYNINFNRVLPYIANIKEKMRLLFSNFEYDLKRYQ